MATFIFKRYEKKFILDPDSYTRLSLRLNPLLFPDTYPEFYVANLYMDTPDFFLAKKSAGSYREKLRLRVYLPPDTQGSEDPDHNAPCPAPSLIPPHTQAFIELKKKIQGVSYKRRVQMTLADAERFLKEGIFPADPCLLRASAGSHSEDASALVPDPLQVLREISYTISHYNLSSRAITAYQRKAFILEKDPLVRVTFDSGLRYRTTDLSLTHGLQGTALIDPSRVIMEIKTPYSLPSALTRILSEEGVFSASFSKYSAAYAAERRKNA